MNFVEWMAITAKGKYTIDDRKQVKKLFLNEVKVGIAAALNGT